MLRRLQQRCRRLGGRVLQATSVTIQLRDRTLTICPCSGPLEMKDDMLSPLIQIVSVWTGPPQTMVGRQISVAV